MKNTKWISNELDSIIIAREKQSLFRFLGDCQVGNAGKYSRAAGQGLLGDKHAHILWKILHVWSLNPRVTSLANHLAPVAFPLTFLPLWLYLFTLEWLFPLMAYDLGTLGT